MNQYDSEKLWQQLAVRGYLRTDQPSKADLVLVNTCAIREKPEHKLYSFLGRMNKLKQKRPELKIGVCGCVAQQRGAQIFERAPQVDLVFGTDAIFQLPRLLEQAEQGERVLENDWKPLPKGRVEDFVPTEWTINLPFSEETSSVTSQIAITKGCNNMCTFCVVPYTRGREISRRASQIVSEAKSLVKLGVKEINLLGQNVNSYRAEGISFVELLAMLNKIKGLARIRYISPHPKDVKLELAQAHKNLSALCEHLHLPLQSGSDRILKAMRRGYTRENFYEKVALMYSQVPSLTLSTDIIVGFPAETESDFERTLEVVNQVRFQHIYAFKYSSRPGTPAAKFSLQIPEDIKQERLLRLLNLQQEISQPQLKKLVGTKQQVLVEYRHPRSSKNVPLMGGRTRGHVPVMLAGENIAIGELLTVSISHVRQHSLVAQAYSKSPAETAA